MNITFSAERQEKLNSMFNDVRDFEYSKLIKSLEKFLTIRESFKIFIDLHLVNFKNAENCLKVAFLHNAIEKSYLTEKALEKQTNLWVSSAIKALTQNRKEKNNSIYLKSYYTRILSMPKEVLIVKICDKFDNVLAQCLKKDDDERMMYFNEIELYILPYLSEFTPKLANVFHAMLNESIQLGYLKK